MSNLCDPQWLEKRERRPFRPIKPWAHQSNPVSDDVPSKLNKQKKLRHVKKEILFAQIVGPAKQGEVKQTALTFDGMESTVKHQGRDVQRTVITLDETTGLGFDNI